MSDAAESEPEMLDISSFTNNNAKCTPPSFNNQWLNCKIKLVK